MNNPTALILTTSHVMQLRPSLWGNLEALLKEQKKTLPNLYPIICVNGDCPETIQEKYEVVLGEVNPYEDKEKRFDILVRGVNAAAAAGKMKTMITHYGTGINNKNFFKKNMSIVGSLIENSLDFDCIFCKTKTATRLMKYKWDQTITDHQNNYKMFYNVVGNDIKELIMNEEHLWKFEFFSKGITIFHNGENND